MSTAGRVAIAAAAAALSVALAFALLGSVSIPLLGRPFLAVGSPLGHLILEFAPDALLRALAPQGGPDAVAWAMALGILATWFALFFAAWFVVFGAMRRRQRKPSFDKS
jgi:hypothetical protein